MKPPASLCSDFKLSYKKRVLRSLGALHPKNTRATPKNVSSEVGITENVIKLTFRLGLCLEFEI